MVLVIFKHCQIRNPNIEKQNNFQTSKIQMTKTNRLKTEINSYPKLVVIFLNI
jgi:hypothetical protein